MIDSFTVKELSIGLSLFAGIVTSSTILHRSLKKWIKKQFNDNVAPIKSEIKELKKTINRVDMSSCQNFLVRCIVDFENNDEISETEKQRFYENYEHYLKNGGNSYIKHKVEKLETEGKL